MKIIDTIVIVGAMGIFAVGLVRDRNDLMLGAFFALLLGLVISNRIRFYISYFN